MSDMLDLFVIGAGSGGVRAGRIAAKAGAKVAVAEEYRTGGTCVIRGCVPKKLLVYGSEFSRAFKHAEGFGWSIGETRFDWAALRDSVAAEVTRLEGIYARNLQAAGAELHLERAIIAGPNTVRLEKSGREIKTKRILIATGGRPSMPVETPGWELAISSNECFNLPKLPKKILIAGGGYIAVEFACIFLGLGVDTTLIYRGEQILRGFDDDIRNFAAGEMRKHGVDVRVNADVRSILRTSSGLDVQLADGQTLAADTVLYATGRTPNVHGLGLDRVGVAQRENGAVVVSDHYQSSVPSIYALGDVTDRVQLTPVALGEAMQLVDHLFGNGQRRMSYDGIPTAVFTHPNIGTVGLTEAEARATVGAVRIFRSEFRPLKHTLSGSSERTLMKLVVDANTDRVLGVHMVGADAGEIVQGFAVALKAGATKAVFDATVGIHPTAAEEFVTMREPVAP